MEVNMTLSGSGGQGLGLAGMIMAEAGILEGKEAIQSQSYGPEARGGASKSDVIIGDEELDFPKVLHPEILLAMSQPAYDKYKDDVTDDAVILVDSTLVKLPEHTGDTFFALPITKTAKEDVGNVMCASMVALGALSALTGVVSHDTLMTAVANRAPKGTAQMNCGAAELGYQMGVNAKKN